MKAIVFIIVIVFPFNIFLNTSDLKIGDYKLDIPQF